MALKKDYFLDVKYQCQENLSLIQDIELLPQEIKAIKIENAYIKIDKIEGNKNLLNLHVGIYKSSDCKMLLKNRMFEFDNILLDSDNFIKQGYLFLKTLPEFANAIDC